MGFVSWQFRIRCYREQFSQSLNDLGKGLNRRLEFIRKITGYLGAVSKFSERIGSKSLLLKDVGAVHK